MVLVFVLFMGMNLLTHRSSRRVYTPAPTPVPLNVNTAPVPVHRPVREHRPTKPPTPARVGPYTFEP
jgi:hypothetical protein